MERHRTSLRNSLVLGCLRVQKMRILPRLQPGSETPSTSTWNRTERLKIHNIKLQQTPSIAPSCSFIFAHSHTLLDTSACFLRSLSIEYSVFLAGHLVVVDEEFLHFLDKLLAEIVNVLDECEFVVVLFDGDQTIVALLPLSVALFSFNDSNQSALNQATLQSRLIHQSQDIYRVAVLGSCRR